MKTDPIGNPFLAALKILALAGLGIGVVFYVVAMSAREYGDGSKDTLFAVAFAVLSFGTIFTIVWLHAGALTWKSSDAASPPPVTEPETTTTGSEATEPKATTSNLP